MPRPKKTTKSGKRLADQGSVNSAIKAICDIMRRSNCAGAMQYVPELTWILFLRILDDRETKEREEAEAQGTDFLPSLKEPFRWSDWAAPSGPKRVALENATLGAFFAFVNGELLPYLRGLKNQPNASPRQKVISEILSGVDRVRMDTEKNFRDVLDKVHALHEDAVDNTHVFAISQVYEGLLLKMGEKGNDGGQFFTPREIIRAMVQVADPKIGETVFDPCCGTGGFLAQAYEYMAGPRNAKIRTPEDLDALKHRTFYGREKENLIYPIGLANLILHGIDSPRIWHGNTLTQQEVYGGLFEDVPAQFDVVLTNPPFGGKEGKEAVHRFAYKTGATQVLFLQEIMAALKNGGRCAVVLDEGVLFRTNESAFVDTKRKLLDECNLWCIVSLPGGVFLNAGAGVKTNLLFFTKGEETKRIWYYDLSDIKVGKKSPFTRDRFEEFFRLLPKHGKSDRSWTIDFRARLKKAKEDAAPFRHQALTRKQAVARLREELSTLKKSEKSSVRKCAQVEEQISEKIREEREFSSRAAAIEDAAYDLKAVNPHRRIDVDSRSSAQIVLSVQSKSKEILALIDTLRAASS